MKTPTLFAAVALLLLLSLPLRAIDIGGVVHRATSATKTVADQVDKAQPAGTDALVKRADTELRAAERKMFSGDKAGAQTLLTSAGGLITQIETADAQRRELPALKQKHARLQADLDRRIGKTAPTAAAPAAAQPATRAVSATAGQRAMPAVPAPGAAKPIAPAAAANVKLPYAAREALASFTKLNRSVENKFLKMEEAKKGETTVPPATYAKEIQQLHGEMQTVLAEAKTAAGASAAGHPELVAAQAALDAIPARLQQTSASVADAQAARQATSEGIAADVEQLTSEYNRLRAKTFDKAGGAAIYYNDLGPVTNLLAVIEDFENNDVAQAQKLLSDFHAKYGATEDDIRAKTDDSAAARTCANLEQGVADVAKTRTAMAEDLAEKITQRLSGMDSAHDFARMARHDEVRAWLAVAQQFDKENAKVVELTQRCEQALADDLTKFKGKIASRKWPAHAASAPADAKKLAAIALDWFKSSPDWGARKPDPAAGRQPYEILAVSVTGPWSVQERNILGEPVMYGLPILLAVQLPSDKDAELARVFALTMRTAEFKGVRMEPPFDSVAVGDSYFIMPAAVK